MRLYTGCQRNNYALAKCRGFIHVRGVNPSDTPAAYFAETGEPLLNAAQAAEFCEVQVRTIYQWVRRHRLAVAGLDDDGLQLFSATDLARLLSRRLAA